LRAAANCWLSGAKPNRLGEIGDGALAIALGIPSQSAGVVEGSVLCIQTDRLGEIGYRLLEVFFFDPTATHKSHIPIVPHDAAHIMVVSTTRIEADRLVEVGDGTVGVVLRNKDLAAPVVGVGVFRIEADGLIEIGDGAVEIAFRLPSETAVGVDVDMTAPEHIRVRQRIDADRIGQIGDGAIGIALFAPKQTAIVVSESIPRIEANGVGIVGQGMIQIALGLPGETAGDIGDGVHGIALGIVLDDARATRNVAIRIVGIAILMGLQTCGHGRCRDQHQHARHRRH